jgi:hypothetical protein
MTPIGVISAGNQPAVAIMLPTIACFVSTAVASCKLLLHWLQRWAVQLCNCSTTAVMRLMTHVDGWQHDGNSPLIGVGVQTTNKCSWQLLRNQAGYPGRLRKPFNDDYH